MRALSTEIGLLWLRVTLGLMMLFGHGWGKLERLLGINTERPASFGDGFLFGGEIDFALAAISETVFAALLILGLATRLAAIPLIVTMSVAAFMVHAADPLFLQPARIDGQAVYLVGKEFALLFLTGFVAIALLGPGKFALDTFAGPLTRKLWSDRQQNRKRKKKKK